MQEKITAAIKTSLKAGEKLKTSTLRLMLSAIKDRTIQARTEKDGADGLTDDQIISLLQGMIKQRHQSIEMFEKGGRPELAAKEQAEIVVIQEFLPEALSEEKVLAAIQACIKETGATDIKGMGPVIALLKQKYAGQIDFSKAAGLIKAQLG